MSRNFIGRVLVVMVCLGLVASTAQAQKQRMQTTINGTLKGVQGNLLMVQAASGEQWKVIVSPKNAVDVSYTGTAEPSFLQPGLPVKFTGKFNGKGMGQEPVSELTIFSGNEFGIQDEGAEASLFGGEAGKKPAKKPPVDPTAISSLNVQGQIKSVKNGKMMVSAGSKMVSCDLAETASVKVEVSGPAVLKFLQEGDTVDIAKAWTEGPGAATAEDAKITGGKPLVGKTPKPLVASKPTAPGEAFKPAPEPTKPEGAKPDGAKPEEGKPEGAKPGEAPKPGFNANPLFNK